ncbi:MAG: Crp/Fnr family transcriptional regulator [Anaerolineae bacterium]
MSQESQANTQQLIDQLRRIPFLNGLNLQALTAMAQSAVRRHYAAGEIIFLDNEPSAGLYVLQSGWVKVVKLSTEGREQILRFIGPNEAFNELGILANRPTPATAIALEPSEVWLVPRATLAQLLSEHPEFAQLLLENMADRVTYLVGLVADLSLRPVISRLAQLLLADAQGDVLPRPQWYTQAQLAARLGTVPDVVQRALSSLAADHIIEVERHEIRILDRSALEIIASP